MTCNAFRSIKNLDWGSLVPILQIYEDILSTLGQTRDFGSANIHSQAMPLLQRNEQAYGQTYCRVLLTEIRCYIAWQPRNASSHLTTPVAHTLAHSLQTLCTNACTPHLSTKFGERTFFCAGPGAWKSLPDDL